MKSAGWRQKIAMVVMLGLFCGCVAPPAPADPPLTRSAVEQTLNAWNPQYCKFVELYGFYKGEGAGATQVAYVLVANPEDKQAKTQVFAARFQLLTLADGRQQWFLTSLMTHSAGLSRRGGWDNLMIAVKDKDANAASR